MDCLANTGFNALPVVIVGLLIVGTGIFFATRAKRSRAGWTALIVLPILLGAGLATQTGSPATAATATNCSQHAGVAPAASGQPGTTGQTGTTIPTPTGTVEPSVTPTPTSTPDNPSEPFLAQPIVIPASDYTGGVNGHFNVLQLGLHSPLIGQTVDWSTFDLDPATPGVQQSVQLPGSTLDPSSGPGTLVFDPATQMLTAFQPYNSDFSWVVNYEVKDSFGNLSTISTIRWAPLAA
jgi:hypothetical protein